MPCRVATPSRAALLATMAACLMVVVMTAPANAFGWGYHDPNGPDPYAYRYEPRGYYPYYNSRYWRPGRLVRKRRGIRGPRYYPAWGLKKRRYRHQRWHERRYGGHPFWYW